MGAFLESSTQDVSFMLCFETHPVVWRAEVAELNVRSKQTRLSPQPKWILTPRSHWSCPFSEFNGGDRPVEGSRAEHQPVFYKYDKRFMQS